MTAQDAQDAVATPEFPQCCVHTVAEMLTGLHEDTYFEQTV